MDYLEVWHRGKEYCRSGLGEWYHQYRYSTWLGTAQKRTLVTDKYLLAELNSIRIAHTWSVQSKGFHQTQHAYSVLRPGRNKKVYSAITVSSYRRMLRYLKEHTNKINNLHNHEVYLAK